ncbi:MAG TPA: ATP-binding protein [Rhabdochlamydiaceae bacterium]|nr:ATP-binding protein [Rhabdochlamydiaceae bacterium]
MRRAIEPILKKWKDQSGRLPIILRGARQVGKSFIIEKFGKENFESLVTCNFEFRPELISCFDSFDPLAICAKLEVAFKLRIIPGKTLLFLDEIQNCPKAITALRYFKEKLPALHVIAAGSLLEFALHEEQFSFPVGRVQFLYLKPLSFYEYLVCQNHDKLVELLDNVTLQHPLEPFIHEQLLLLLREYFLIGGMPSVVRCFLETRSFLECQTLLTGLLATYRTDFPKYASKTQYKHLQTFFERAPGLVSQHFKYTLVSPEHRSQDLKIALEQLGWAGLLYKVLATSASGLPLQTHAKESKFKLLFLDGGLVNCANKLDIQTAWDTDLLQINSGAQAEQFVGQELLAYAEPHMSTQLYYWERDKKGSMAEVDYIIQAGSHIWPIEVKAGTTGSLKSLAQFLLEKHAPFGIRISQHPLSFYERVLSVPLYLIGQLPRLIASV